MQIMINYYWVLYMDNVEIPRITKNINIFTKYNYLSHIQDFESRIISPKSNFEFLFKDGRSKIKKEG